MPPHPLANFEIQNKPKFNGVYLRDNLHKIRDCAFVVNLDEYELVWTHWIALYIDVDNETYFDSFGNEYFPK